MVDYFDLEKYVREAIAEYRSQLGALSESEDPMSEVSMQLHDLLVAMGDDWTGFQCGMMATYVFLTYCGKKDVKRLAYIS